MTRRFAHCLVLLATVLTTDGADNPLKGNAMDLPPLVPEDFSFGYWLNGWRKSPDDTSADVLCFESGYYGFTLDVADLRRARFGTLNDNADYTQALEARARRIRGLPPADLAVELEVGGKVYRTLTCKAGTEKDIKHLRYARLWESGRWVQHFDLLGLVFVDSAGNRLGCDGTLDLVAWPKSLTLTAELTPSLIYRDGPAPGLSGNGVCVIKKPVDIPHSPKIDPKNLTVECWVRFPKTISEDNAGWLVCKNGNEWQDGNYGFTTRNDRVSAILNIGGGRKNQVTIHQRRRPLRTDGWHYLALSYDGKTMCFYLDGRKQGATEVGKPRVPGRGLMRIGGRADGFGKPVRALFDQVRVWNRALSPEEVKAHAGSPTQVGSREGLTFNEDFDSGAGAAPEPPVWSDARLSVRLRTNTYDWHAEKRFPGPWKSGKRRQVTLACDLRGREPGEGAVAIQVSTPEKQTFPVTFDKSRNCIVARVKGLKRNWKTGYTDIRDYDEFEIAVQNTGDKSRRVPFLLDLVGLANPTGLCPMLCYEDGVPTGIPVQLSKNWHYQQIGSYLRAYMLIPSPPGASAYKLRIVYGFYGTLPSASQAQLCLVGYGGNGRWDQLAIGCWGETFCLDMDMSLTDIAITDVRMLMTRNGRNGRKWSWSDAGWGGDWLCVYDAKDQKLHFSGMKTAYLAHGPCLTEVRYAGRYGSKREVDLTATVQTLRTDDYARTFHILHYAFNKELSADSGWLFKMGRTGALVTPRIAYGNGKGLIARHDVPRHLKLNERFVDRVTLSGAGPWWVAFPGATSVSGRDWGTGSRALIIRSYRASFGGAAVIGPTISMPVHHVQKDGRLDLDLLLVPPEGVQRFKPGDSVFLDLEWITLPRIADDYYGPNDAFRQHLTDNPRSWKTVYREAKGNALKLNVTGGTVTNSYPIIIQVDQVARPEIRVEIEGGVGMVPIRFEGLRSATGWAMYRAVGGKLLKLDQSVHGNDFWQTDFNTGSRSYRMSFNLPLDGLETSTWVLKRSEKTP